MTVEEYCRKIGVKLFPKNNPGFMESEITENIKDFIDSLMAASDYMEVET